MMIGFTIEISGTATLQFSQSQTGQLLIGKMWIWDFVLTIGTCTFLETLIVTMLLFLTGMEAVGLDDMMMLHLLQ